MRLRAAAPGDAAAVAALWESGWHDAHAAVVPPALTAQRTPESFRIRTIKALPQTRVLEGDGAIIGFWMQRGAEVYQFYVAAMARGTDTGPFMMRDARAVLAAAGHRRGWLHCSPGNLRARRFYEKTGWHLVMSEDATVDTLDGPFALSLWRFETDLQPAH